MPADGTHGVGVIAVHVLENRGGRIGERVGFGRGIVRRRHPPHHAEAADEIDVRHLEREEREVRVVDPVPRRRMASEIALPLRVGNGIEPAHHAGQRGSRRAERVGAVSALHHQEAGFFVGEHVLRVNGHRADEKEWPRLRRERIRHDRGERKAGIAERLCGQRADPLRLEKSAYAFGMRRLRRRRRRERGSVLRHPRSMAHAARPTTRAA